MINVSNDGMHDFGYPCFMPEQVTIDGLLVEDLNTPEGYEGMYFFTDPDGFHDDVNDVKVTDDRPFPYASCKQITLRGLTTASGKSPRISPNASLSEQVTVSEN